MSIKSTRTVSRARAQIMLMREIPLLSNESLARMLDTLADSGDSQMLSICDNFIVVEFDGDDDESFR